MSVGESVDTNAESRSNISANVLNDFLIDPSKKYSEKALSKLLLKLR